MPLEFVVLDAPQSSCISSLETFKACDETFSLEYNWAKWDFENWLMKMTPIDASLFEGNLARISFDNVYRSGSKFSLAP